MVKKLLRHERGIPDRRLMHPHREWSIGLLISLLLSVSGGVYAFITFVSYSAISVESEAVEVDQLHYQRADAQAAIELYETKRDTYTTLLEEARQYEVPEPVETIEIENAVETPLEDTPDLGLGIEALGEANVSNVINAVE